MLIYYFSLLDCLTSFISDSNKVEDLSESKDEPPADVVRLCQETMSKTAIYLRGELEGTVWYFDNTNGKKCASVFAHMIVYIVNCLIDDMSEYI